MKRIQKVGIISGLIIGLLGAFGGVVNLIPMPKVCESNPWMKEDKALISAHRGGAFLNPENTKKAFDYVIKETTYTDIVEIDIHTTKDGVIVINHDESINRMALDEGSEVINIVDYTFDELKQYNLGRNFVDVNYKTPYYDYNLAQAEDAGLTMMSLEEFFLEYENVRDFRLFLEIKEKGEAANIVADRVQEMFNMPEYTWWKDKTMIISFTDSVIDYIAENYPEQYIGALGYKIAPEFICQKLGLNSLCKPNYHCLQTKMSNSAGPITIDCATKGMVNMAHNRNQAITYWTINEVDDMEKVISIGADIITTNAPDVLASLLGKL